MSTQSRLSTPPVWYPMTRFSKRLRTCFRSICSARGNNARTASRKDSVHRLEFSSGACAEVKNWDANGIVGDGDSDGIVGAGMTGIGADEINADSSQECI